MSNQKLLTDGERAEIFARHIRTSGWLYMVAYKKLNSEFGLAGRSTIRQWMREWGVWRGQQLRKAHMALGWDISMENLMFHWDSAAATTPDLIAAWPEDKRCHFHPNCVRVVTEPGPHNCPQAVLWQEHDFWMEAHVHCDEFHVKFTQGYHPEAVCVIPENMMKNDPTCNFSFLLAADAQPAPPVEPYPGENVLLDWQEDTPADAQESALRRKARITAGRISFLWKAIRENHPEDGERVFAEIMYEWCAERGGDLKKYLAKNGLDDQLNAATVKYFDHPYYLSWNAEISETADEVKMEVNYCPFAETWKWLDEEALPILRRYYCQQCYKGVFSQAFPGSDGELAACQLGGDEKCTIVLKKPAE